MTKLRDIRENWEALGREDPLWAVLADPAMRGGRWNPAEFFATGEREIAGILDRLVTLGIEPHPGRALDFGCGAGRLTRALAARFETVLGIDVAETMLATARRLSPDLPNVEYVHNTRPDLAVVPGGSIDFLYCNLVLQHMPPILSTGYIREFARVLSPAGIAAFQIPTRGPRRPAWRRAARRLRDQLLGQPRMGMYAVPRDVVAETLDASGATIAAELPNSTYKGWPGTTYIVRLAPEQLPKGTSA